MNYKNINKRELADIAEHFPNEKGNSYSIPEILYSIIRIAIGSEGKVKDIKNLTEQELYTAINNAKQIENE